MTAFQEHPQRAPLAEEAHARPYLLLRAPVRLSHLAAVGGERSPADDRAHMAELCRAFGAAPPGVDATHFTGQLGRLTAKWERHTEFSSYTFALDGPFEQPFKEMPAELLPPDWLRGLPGPILAATHVVVEPMATPDRPVDATAALFEGNTVIGSALHDGQARAWTDARIHADGFGRILVKDLGLNRRQLGRMVQRLIEIDTYRMMALLAFPLAREARPKVAVLEKQLAEVVRRLPSIAGIDDESALLKQLSALAADAEAIAVSTNYRFSAARAYSALVRQRVEDLRETRLDWMQPFGMFLERRLAPAMETCENVAARQESLSVRISRASNLLRTRVDVALEAQNRDLLRSMDRRARLQLRLQQTVEGLSVAAISYYVVGLVSYLAKGAEHGGLPVNPEIVAGASIPFVIAAVWLGLRALKKAIGKAQADP